MLSRAKKMTEVSLKTDCNMNRNRSNVRGVSLVVSSLQRAGIYHGHLLGSREGAAQRSPSISDGRTDRRCSAWARPPSHDCHLGQVKNNPKEIWACKVREHRVCIGNIWSSKQCLCSPGAGGGRPNPCKSVLCSSGGEVMGTLRSQRSPPKKRATANIWEPAEVWQLPIAAYFAS